jgi:hypothetical protein
VSRGGAGGYGLPVGGVTTARLADGAVTAVKLADEAVTAAKLEAVDITALAYGVPFFVVLPFVAGTPGSPGDITVFNANCPYKLRYIDSFVKVSTAVGSSTLTLRTATAGGGNQLSSAMATASAAALARDALGGAGLVNHTLAVGASLYGRASDIGIAGTLYIEFLRID